MTLLPPLPARRRIDRDKIEQYLLHPVNGRGKAAFFESLGFSLASWTTLRAALMEHAQTAAVSEVRSSAYGTRYVVRGTLRTPAEREPQALVCGVWQADNGSEGVRLITAYPD